MKTKTLLLLFLLTAALRVSAQESGSCPVVHITPERLPNMTIPRSGHNTFYANGELTVTGGHTTNFVTTQTAEYFADGQWHPMTMAYSHDNGFAVSLRSGEVLIGGGHDEPLGIGQTFLIERYNPQTHTFEGFGCLDRRRVLAAATLMGDGRVIISGNHYADDAIGCYDGHSQVADVKSVRQGRSNPYILRTTGGDALILGGCDVRDRRHDTIWVDRLSGDAFRVPLLDEWWPAYTDQPFSSDACSIGEGRYLLCTRGPDWQLGIVVVSDTTFTLLPTASPVPMQCHYGPIDYKAPIVVDTLHRRAYLIGVDTTLSRQFVLAVDYAQRPAPLTLYYTDPMERVTATIPVVTPDGDLLLAGGTPNDNYRPLADVWLYHFATELPTAAASWTTWLWACLALAVAVVVIILFIRRQMSAPSVSSLSQATAYPSSPTVDNWAVELMTRICQVMDEERPYLRSDLKLQDLAVRLQTNSSYVSECINSLRGQSFSQFVNTYRIHYAQELLRQQPDLKTAIVASKSGFSTEASFFRNFKAVTGMTPREWLNAGVCEG